MIVLALVLIGLVLLGARLLRRRARGAALPVQLTRAVEPLALQRRSRRHRYSGRP